MCVQLVATLCTLCHVCPARKYTVGEYERMANEYMRKKFATTGTLPPRQVEVRSSCWPVLSCCTHAPCTLVHKHIYMRACVRAGICRQAETMHARARDSLFSSAVLLLVAMYHQFYLFKIVYKCIIVWEPLKIP